MKTYVLVFHPDSPTTLETKPIVTTALSKKEANHTLLRALMERNSITLEEARDGRRDGEWWIEEATPTQFFRGLGLTKESIARDLLVHLEDDVAFDEYHTDLLVEQIVKRMSNADAQRFLDEQTRIEAEFLAGRSRGFYEDNTSIAEEQFLASIGFKWRPGI